MLTRVEDVDVHALARQGWTISAIARHLGRDRQTIRAYLAGDRQPGVRKRSLSDSFEPFVAYCAHRLGLWATRSSMTRWSSSAMPGLPDFYSLVAHPGPSSGVGGVPSHGRAPGGGD